MEIYIRMLEDHQGAKKGDVLRFEHPNDAQEVLTMERGELVVPVLVDGERTGEFATYVAPEAKA